MKKRKVKIIQIGLVVFVALLILLIFLFYRSEILSAIKKMPALSPGIGKGGKGGGLGAPFSLVAVAI